VSIMSAIGGRPPEANACESLSQNASVPSSSLHLHQIVTQCFYEALLCKVFISQGVLTPKLTCCQSGFLDECGVCDGDGSACPTMGIVDYQPSSFQRRLSHSLSRSTLRQLSAIAPEFQAVADEFIPCMCMLPTGMSAVQILHSLRKGHGH
jgi:hypothetical protein